MDEIRATDVADAAGAILAGLGILTIQFFPFALPLLVLVIGPLLLLALALALPLVVLAAPLLLLRALVRRLRRPHPDGPRPDALGPKHVLRPRVVGQPRANRALAVRVDDQ
jgi:membrane protein implicated in regulation of membrane protease activity